MTLRGRLRVNINLGTLPWSDDPTDNTIDAGSLLDDDQWHDVHIVRQEKNLNISVDRIQVWRNLSAIFLHTNMNRNVSFMAGAFLDISARSWSIIPKAVEVKHYFLKIRTAEAAHKTDRSPVLVIHLRAYQIKFPLYICSATKDEVGVSVELCSN